MVADLCHFEFLCLRPERWKATTRKHIFLSLLRPLRFEAKTRRHDKQRATTRKILPADTKFSTKKFSCLRLLKCCYFAQYISCFCVFAPQVESRNNNRKTCFVFSPFGAKVKRRKHETWLFVVISTFAFRGEDTKTRQHERFLHTDTKLSTKKFSCLRLLKCRYFV